MSANRRRPQRRSTRRSAGLKNANMIPKAVVGVNRAIAAAIGATRDESDDSDPGYAGSIQSPHRP